MAAQLAEQLLKIGQRYRLPLADARERHRTLALAHGQVNHRSHSKTAFGSQTHHNLGSTQLKYRSVHEIHFPIT
ncbi:hypothetical protein ACHMW6_23640 [Pseudoduganella sp. UC29_106]|uniref:hypothetical protein n=1 Tax=Pseudoduganella sp. UC29_106 TaxID=3374553 RepID=UPI00375741CF